MDASPKQVTFVEKPIVVQVPKPKKKTQSSRGGYLWRIPVGSL